MGPCEHENHHVVRTDGGEIHARSVVVATGVRYRKLGIEAWSGWSAGASTTGAR